MAYEPPFTITPRLLSLVEEIAALRELFLGAAFTQNEGDTRAEHSNRG